MNAALGVAGVWMGFLAALAGVGAGVASLWRRSEVRRPSRWLGDARAFAPVVLAGAVLSTAAMEHALVTHDFSLVFVAENNSRATPLLYSITGLWSALAGSILLWGLGLALIGAALIWRYRNQFGDPVVRWASMVVYAVTAFFFGLMIGPANPFTTTHGVTQGLGPNALLQDNPLVAIHPPLLYLGFVGFTVPFAFAVAMLATGRVSDRWQIETRRWTLVAWTFLSLGLVLGAWWSYQVLGWGGFWGWDPVENAALMPWLCGTAYLHSVLVQERRGLMRVWNLSLSVATFSLTILGTFLTRSGIVQSVHSFSESTLGPLLISFFGLCMLVGFGLIAWRGDRLRSPGGIDAPLGREGAFLLNNLLFVGFAFVVLLGTVFPLLYEAIRGQQVSVGAPYFNAIAVPVGLALLLLMAVAPALSWRKIDAGVLWGRLAVPATLGVATIAVCVTAGVRGLAPLVAFGLGAFAASSAGRSLVLSVRASRRHRSGWWRGFVGRTNGGMIVHFGVVVLAVGLAAATSFAQRRELPLAPGQVVHFDGHTFEYVGVRTVQTPASRASQAAVLVDGGGPFLPAISQFGGSQSVAVGTPAIDSGLFGDVYLTFDEVGNTGRTSGSQVVPNLPAGSVAIGVVVEPLLAWMWAGGLLVGLGGLLALVPGSRRRPTEPVSATVGGGGNRKARGAPDPPGALDGQGEPASPAALSPEPVGVDAP